jgi:hypothetical protein
MRKYIMGRSAGGAVPGGAIPGSAPVPGAPAATGAAADVTTVSFICRAVDQTLDVANSKLAYNVKDLLKASPYFTEPIVLGSIERHKEESTNTFIFPVSVQLKKPFKL